MGIPSNTAKTSKKMGILMSSTAFQRKMAIFFVNSHVFYTISEEKWQLSW